MLKKVSKCKYQHPIRTNPQLEFAYSKPSVSALLTRTYSDYNTAGHMGGGLEVQCQDDEAAEESKAQSLALDSS